MSETKKKSRRVGKYEIGISLGEGTFGKVKKAVNVETGEVVAIKILDKEKIQKQNMGSQVKKEISIMKLVRHHFVVKLKEVLASKTKIFIVLELVTGGELFDKIVEAQRFDEETARFYFQQLVVGTIFCHNNGVCHRDLKPENLLLDGNQNLKISDFGLSSMYEGGDGGPDKVTLLHTTCGTPNYVAPEVLADRGYDGYMADTWSIGVILFVFLAGYLPFDEPTMSALFRKISNADFSYPSWFGDDVKDLLDKILVADPKTRLSLMEIIKHPWFTRGGPLSDPALIQAEIEGRSPVDAADSNEGSDGKESEESNKKKLAQTPSEADIKAAIHHDDSLHHNEETKNDAPEIINSFDLINACGGAALNRMFLTSEEKKQRKAHLYISSLSIDDIQKNLITKFKAENKDSEVSSAGYSVRAAIPSVPQVAVEATIKVMSEDPIVHFIELRRARGDILQYIEICEGLDKTSEDGTKSLEELFA
jgi:serine/threonine protein kinase